MDGGTDEIGVLVKKKRTTDTVAAKVDANMKADATDASYASNINNPKINVKRAAVLSENSNRSNDVTIIIKHYHHVFKPYLQTINFSSRSEMEAMIIFDGCISHLNIDLLKELGGDDMVVLIRMTKTSH